MILERIVRDRLHRVIVDRFGVAPYLTRHYLSKPPHMPDGSFPFDQYGDVRPGAVQGRRRWGRYLHQIHLPDADHAPHCHPWEWCFSIILHGGYVEERPGRRDRRLRRGSFNFLRHTDYHRIDSVEPDTWTFFVTGPRLESDWGFMVDGQFVRWQDRYVNLRP